MSCKEDLDIIFGWISGLLVFDFIVFFWVILVVVARSYVNEKLKRGTYELLLLRIVFAVIFFLFLGTLNWVRLSIESDCNVMCFPEEFSRKGSLSFGNFRLDRLSVWIWISCLFALSATLWRYWDYEINHNRSSWYCTMSASWKLTKNPFLLTVLKAFRRFAWLWRLDLCLSRWWDFNFEMQCGYRIECMELLECNYISNAVHEKQKTLCDIGRIRWTVSATSWLCFMNSSHWSLLRCYLHTRSEQNSKYY